MSRRRQLPWADTDGTPTGRPYVAIAVYCVQHPTRRLAWFGRCTEPGADGSLLVSLAQRGQSQIRPDGETKVHIRCGLDCSVDQQWRMEHVARDLAAMFAPGRSETHRIEV